MIQRLPRELARDIFQSLDTQDKRKAESVSREWYTVTRAHAWTAADYPFGRGTFCHVLAPRTSPGWHAVSAERRQLDRAMAPLLQRVPPDTWLGIASAYNDGGHFGHALALMFSANFPETEEACLPEILRALQGQRRALADNVALKMRENDKLRAAIEADDADGLGQTWVYCESQHYWRIMEQAARGRLNCYSLACGLLAASDQRARFGDISNPLYFALVRRRAAMVRIALQNGFPITPVQVRQADVFIHGAQLLPMLLGPGAAPGNLAAAMTCVLAAPTLRLNRLQALGTLIQAGGDVNAPLITVPPRSPFLACFNLQGRNIAPLLRQLVVAGANPHAVDQGENAWHRLARSRIGDFDAVAAILQQVQVDINVLSSPPAPVRASPLYLSSLIKGAASPRRLELCGASVQGTHLLVGDRQLNAMEAAMISKDSELAFLALREGIVPPRDALVRGASWMLPAPFTALVDAHCWRQSDLNNVFERVLTTNGRRPRALSPDGRLAMLSSLARAGARVNRIASPWRARGTPASQRNVAPGLWPTSALMMAAPFIGRTDHRPAAMPYMQAFRAMGGDLHARGPAGTNAWHALVTLSPPDAVAVAQLLLNEGVDVTAQAEGPNGPVTPLDAVAALGSGLRPLIEEAVLVQQWNQSNALP